MEKNINRTTGGTVNPTSKIKKAQRDNNRLVLQIIRREEKESGAWNSHFSHIPLWNAFHRLQESGKIFYSKARFGYRIRKVA